MIFIFGKADFVSYPKFRATIAITSLCHKYLKRRELLAESLSLHLFLGKHIQVLGLAQLRAHVMDVDTFPL